MLLCLDADLRVAFTLGTIFQLNGEEAADILEITPANYRKRLSRARNLMRNFMMGNCDLMNNSGPCKCKTMVPMALKTGWLQRATWDYMDSFQGEPGDSTTCKQLHELDELQRLAVIYRRQEKVNTPETFVNSVRKLMASGRFSSLLS